MWACPLHILTWWYVADEVDALLGKRKDMEHEVSLSMKTEFMSLWDGVETDKASSIGILGATDRPQELDEAVLRRSVLNVMLQVQYRSFRLCQKTEMPVSPQFC